MKAIMVAIGGKDVRVEYSAVPAHEAVQYSAEIEDPTIRNLIGRTVSFQYNPGFNPQWSWPVPAGGGIDAFRMVGEIVKAVRESEASVAAATPR